MSHLIIKRGVSRIHAPLPSIPAPIAACTDPLLNGIPHEGQTVNDALNGPHYAIADVLNRPENSCENHAKEVGDNGTAALFLFILVLFCHFTFAQLIIVLIIS